MVSKSSVAIVFVLALVFITVGLYTYHGFSYRALKPKSSGNVTSTTATPQQPPKISILSDTGYLNISNNQNLTNATSPPSGYYTINDVVTIFAKNSVDGELFSNWSGNGFKNYTGPNNSANIIIEANVNEMANYRLPETTTTALTLTTSTTPQTSPTTSQNTTTIHYNYLPVNISAQADINGHIINLYNFTSQSGYYPVGSTVSIDAEECTLSYCTKGYVFKNWIGIGNGSYTGTDTYGNVTVNGSITEIANYYPINVTTTSIKYTSTIAKNTTTANNQSNVVSQIIKFFQNLFKNI